MKGQAEGNPALWISPHDKLGKRIAPDLIAAAEKNWKRVLSYARRLGLDGSAAADELERAVQSLSSTMERHPRMRARIRNLNDYVFWAAAHKLNRSVGREPKIEYVGSLNDLSVLASAQDSSSVSRLEKELLLKELAGLMNEETRCFCTLQAMDWSWDAIGELFGISANAAQVKFHRGLEKARKRLLGRHRPKTDPTPQPGRSG
jgi:DNA-directed RNA polymerase specialized sigma24 family protein